MREAIANLKQEWMTSGDQLPDFLFKKVATLQSRVVDLEKEISSTKGQGRNIEFCFFDSSTKIILDDAVVDVSGASIEFNEFMTVSIDGEFHNPLKLLGVATVRLDGSKFYAQMNYPFDPSRADVFPSVVYYDIESIRDGKKMIVKKMRLSHITVVKKLVQQPSIKEQWFSKKN